MGNNNRELLPELLLFEKSKKRLTLGGDHSVSIASLAWTLNHYPKSKIIWIDAHADINTFESSKTKK